MTDTITKIPGPTGAEYVIEKAGPRTFVITGHHISDNFPITARSFAKAVEKLSSHIEACKAFDAGRIA
jgi:hypothetical protein